MASGHRVGGTADVHHEGGTEANFVAERGCWSAQHRPVSKMLSYRGTVLRTLYGRVRAQLLRHEHHDDEA